MKVIYLLFLFFIYKCRGYFYPKIVSENIYDKVCGEPLFLTPLIESGQIEKAQLEAKVPPLKHNITSYSGYLTVNKEYNSNLFFWFFLAESNPEKAPVIVWLQGGPGASSLFGLFSENGPFYVNKQRGLKSRLYYWSQVLSIIYIDNPVGTGFSFTDNDNGYAKNEVDVGKDLYSAITQLFQLFPQFRNNDFFVTGESYAGKYVPALAYTIHTNNPKATQKIKLKGVAIGNGLCDPESMMDYGDYLHQIGLIDRKEKSQFIEKQNKIVDLIQQKKYEDAFVIFDELILQSLTPYKSLFFNTTRFEFYFNTLYSKDYSPFGDIGKYLEKDYIRRSIHVGNMIFHNGSVVKTNLQSDVMQSIKPWLAILLENYRALIYNGQLDIIVPYPLTTNFLESINWSGAEAFKTAPKKFWMVNNELAGYSKTVKGLTQVLVRDAGHMVPMDQPLWALDLISRFTYNKPF